MSRIPEPVQVTVALAVVFAALWLLDGSPVPAALAAVGALAVTTVVRPLVRGGSPDRARVADWLRARRSRRR